MRKFLYLTCALLAPTLALAQTTPIETYAYGQSVASAPYGSGLRILAAPSTSASSMQTISASTLLDTTTSQPWSGKTLTGVPLFTGLSSGTCANALALDSGNHLVTFSCAGGGGGLSGMTAGQVPIAATASTVTSSLPLSGTSGATQVQSATSAAKTAGHQLVYDANGNAIDGGAPGSGGTVTNVATTAPITGGPITTAGTIAITGPSNLTTFASNFVPKGATTSPFSASVISDTGTVTSVNYNAAPATGYPAFGIAGVTLQTAAADTVATRIEALGFGAAQGGGFLASGAGGTGASPTALGSGVRIGAFDFGTYDGTNISVSGSLRAVTTQTQSAGNHGTYVEVTTTPNASATPVVAVRVDQNSGIMVPPTVTGGNQGPGTLNASGLFVNGVAVSTGGGGGTAIVYYGITTGSPNIQAITAPTPSSPAFTLTDGYTVKARIGTGLTNTASTTLNVNSTGATNICTQSVGSFSNLVGGELQAFREYTFTYSANSTCYVTQPVLANETPILVSDTVTTGKWFNGQTYILPAGQTITLPNLATTPISTTGSILIITGDNTAIVLTQGTDVINTGQVGSVASGANFYIPADAQVVCTTSGTAGATAYTCPLGPLQYAPLSWATGEDLSLSTGGLDYVRFASPRIVYGIKCKNSKLAGAAQTMQFFEATDAQTIAGGTAVTASAAFDMNANLGAEQTVTLTTTPTLVPAAYSVGSVTTGSATGGSGRCQYTYR